eukprot:CAMPEP_0177288134 /NCGR_PEP_ID=MMETSP0367-20130122/74510_1 /TAXON_ID=447022 ORGANISM="Scrippsiella hangoei-like, Strain SHHI-4" /NCGR_SAMPLE_ID=MMETSP0367 /ASSEMBLY_ACC=CAM_ASM_000362 /LENGTH=31 /DNA_ID= /DNA_START= /DNA_END= /DNA_ORIENTATION=
MGIARTPPAPVAGQASLGSDSGFGDLGRGTI